MRDRTQEVGHRRYARLPVAIPVVGRAAQLGEMPFHGTVRDIGGGGLMAEFPVHLVPGSKVELVLQTRNGPLPVGGQVVWIASSGPQVRHGIAFAEPKGHEFALELVLGENRG